VGHRRGEAGFDRGDLSPEAVRLGGRNVVGLSTLAGFCAAVGFALAD